MTTILVPLSFFSGVNSFTIAIALDKSGLPGTILESFAALNVPSYPGAVEDVASTLKPLLSNTSTYWQEVLPADLTTSGGWFSRDPFPNYGSVNLAVNHGNGWSLGSPTGPQAFEIDGTPIVASAPEPASLLLIATASTLLILRLRRSQSDNIGVAVTRRF